MHVPNNAALLQAPAKATRIVRDGYYVAGDGGQAGYIWRAAACNLNSGAGDGGSQIPARRGGCWTLIMVGRRLGPLVWGCRGDKTTDDTACLQAAVTAVGSAGVPLFLDDGAHGFFISAPITSSAIINFQGVASVPNDGVGNAQNCVSGIFADSDINALVLTGAKVIVQNICIQMTPSTATSRASGAAILLGGSDQGHDIIDGNTIFRPYDGIQVGAGSHSLVRASYVGHNTIRDPARYGIAVGMGTTGGQTVGITLRDNEVGCDAGYNLSGIGFAFFDGAVDWDGTNNGPNNCWINSEIIPGAKQNVNGIFKGVLGDSAGTHNSSGSHDLLIQPRAGSAVIDFLTFDHAWAAGVQMNDNEILITNPFNALLDEVTFTNLAAHGGGAQTVPIVDIEGGVNVSIVGSNICAWGGGATAGPAVKINFNNGVRQGAYSLVGNRIGVCPGNGTGTLATGVSIGGSGIGLLNIQDNDLSQPRSAIAYAPNGESGVVIRNNLGVDDRVGSVADAATITAPITPIFLLSGTGATVTRINGAWSNREIKMITTSGSVSFASGGNICNALSSGGANATVLGTYNAANSCWYLK